MRLADGLGLNEPLVERAGQGRSPEYEHDEGPAGWRGPRRCDHVGVNGTVIVRAPLRIALGGGGTDLHSHYSEHGGFVISGAIDRYVRMSVSPGAGDVFRLEHLEREEVADPADIAHPILRAAIARHGDGRTLDLRSEGDVEPGTGLGSSGAYAVCAVKAMRMLADQDLAAGELAEAACAIEIEDAGRTVGKQDQYAAAHGGVNTFTFARDGTVEVRRPDLPGEVRDALRDQFLLFYTGQSRSAAHILSGQVERTLAGDAGLKSNLLRTCAAARESSRAFEAGDLGAIAELMNEQWALKRERLARVAMPRIEELRATALRAGAKAAMLMGAGGGGYLLVYAPEPAPVRAALAAGGAPELTFGMDTEGCVGRLGGTLQ